MGQFKHGRHSTKNTYQQQSSCRRIHYWSNSQLTKKSRKRATYFPNKTVFFHHHHHHKPCYNYCSFIACQTNKSNTAINNKNGNNGSRRAAFNRKKTKTKRSK